MVMTLRPNEKALQSNNHPTHQLKSLFRRFYSDVAQATYFTPIIYSTEHKTVHMKDSINIK